MISLSLTNVSYTFGPKCKTFETKLYNISPSTPDGTPISITSPVNLSVTKVIIGIWL